MVKTTVCKARELIYLFFENLAVVDAGVPSMRCLSSCVYCECIASAARGTVTDGKILLSTSDSQCFALLKMHLESFPDYTSAPLTLKQQCKLEARRNRKQILSGLFFGAGIVCLHAWKATGELSQPRTIPTAIAGELGAKKLQM